MKNAFHALPKWSANCANYRAAGTSTCCSGAPGAARSCPWTIPRLKIWASSIVHLVKLAVMCPRAVPISSSRRGRACKKREHRLRIGLAGVAETAPMNSSHRTGR